MGLILKVNDPSINKVLLLETSLEIEKWKKVHVETHI